RVRAGDGVEGQTPDVEELATTGTIASLLCSFYGHLVDHHRRDRAVVLADRGRADLLDHVHALHDGAEDGVAPIEVRRRAERDEELAAVRVRTGIGHRKNAGAVVTQIRMELVRELVARPAVALPQRVATLDHEALDHTVKDDAVVVRLLVFLFGLGMRPLGRALGEADEVGDGLRRLGVVELDGEVAERGLEVSKSRHWKNIVSIYLQIDPTIH